MYKFISKQVLFFMALFIALNINGAFAANRNVNNNVTISNVRYSSLPPIGGALDKKIRVVCDLTDSVSVNNITTQVSTKPNAIIVNVKNLNAKKKLKTVRLDGQVATKIDFNNNADSTKAIIYTPEVITNDNYKVTVLPADIPNKKPARLVIDIIKGKKIDTFPKRISPGLKGKVIVLDPGHGGSDPGATGATGSLEKNVTLSVAKMVKSMLVKSGAKVYMTRESDIDVFGANASDVQELRARTQVANNNGADVFISIHADAISNRSVGGTSSFYYPKTAQDKLLARVMQTSIMSQIDTDDRGVREGNFHVLRNSKMPATLVELAFISNVEEEKLLNSSVFQQRLATGIVQGISNYFAVASK